MIERLFALKDARWLPSLLLIVAGMLFIWFIGPRIAIDGRPMFAPASVRIAMMMTLLAAWCSWQVTRWLASRFEIRLAPQPEADDSDGDAAQAELLERIALDDAEARRRLRRRTMRDLPRYLLVGEAGAGKHNLFNQAGLQSSDMVGSAPCCWRFGEQAVLLAAEPQLPPKVWQRLLRPLGWLRRPMFNGIVIAQSAASLLQGDARARQTQAAALRDMLTSTLGRLGHATPVYLIITHCDTLAGFHAYFAAMPAPQRAQVWGLNLPLTAPEQAFSALEEIPAGLDSLVARLYDGEMHRLHAVPDQDERARLLGFPRQFAGLGRRAAQWVATVCKHSRHLPDIRLRGIYFTSVRQQGQPVQPWQGELAATLDRAAVTIAPSRLDYFAASLLELVLLPEAGLAAQGRRTQRALHWRQALAGAALLGFGIWALYAIGAGFEDKRLQLAAARQYGDRINLLARRGIDLTQVASLQPLLDALETSDGNRPGTYWPAVFWSKNAQLLANWQSDTRQRILHQTFAPYVMYRLATEMDNGELAPVDRYRALQLYLMLADPEKLDVPALRDWLRRALATPASGANNVDERLWRKAGDWLAQARNDEGMIPDSHLVDRTRQALAAAPGAPMWWGYLDARLAEDLPGMLTLGEMGGPGAGLVLTSQSGQSLSSGVAMRYTQAGYARYLKLRDHLLEGPTGPGWVLAAPVNAGALGVEKRALDALYFTAYIKAWDSLLNDIALVPIDLHQGSGQALHLLAGPASPLRRLLLEADRQTRFSPENPVTQHFSRLHAAVEPPPGSKQTALDALQARLAGVATYLDTAQSALQHGMPPPAGDAFGVLINNADAYPPPLGKLVRDIARQNGDSQRRQLSFEWQSKVVPFCHQALAQRFPFVANASVETTRDDFARLFRPGGLIDDFFQKNLAMSVDMHGPVWHVRPGAPVSLSPAALQMFRQAAEIRDAFFPDGSNVLSTGFELIPDSLSANSASLHIDIDGQSLRYAHGPIVSSNFKWPGPGDPATRVELTAIDSDEPASLDYRGTWGLFRMISAATPQPAGADRLRLHLVIGDKQAVVLIGARSINNPFRPALLRGFRCTDTL
jgi:type VI secretion system protein ImpL